MRLRWIDSQNVPIEYRWAEGRLPLGRSEADRSAGLIKEEYETQAGGSYCPKSVAGTVELVKPLHGQWLSSDEPRVSR